MQDTDAVESGLFSISTVDGQGVIRLVGSLDYEKTSLHQLKIVAVDRATAEKVRVPTDNSNLIFVSCNRRLDIETNSQ